MKRKNTLILSIIVIILIPLLLVLRNKDFPTYEKNSIDISKKIKEAVLGDGTLELDKYELNSIASTIVNESSLKDKVKGINIDIKDDRLIVKALARKYNHDFYITTWVKVSALDGDIMVILDRLNIGKMPIPKFMAMNYLKSKETEGITILQDSNSILIDGKILLFDIKDLSIVDNKLKIQFNIDIPFFNKSNEEEKKDNNKIKVSKTEEKTKQTKNHISIFNKANKNTAKEEKTSTSSIPFNEDELETVKNLKMTNAQLRDVLKSVKSPESKKWVENVICVNSKMIKDPKGDFSEYIYYSKAQYKKLKEDQKIEVKKAALNNLDLSAVRYLIGIYGI